MNQINLSYHRLHCNINGKGCAGTSAPLTLHLPVIRGNQAEQKDVLLRPLFICRILQITASNKMFLYNLGIEKMSDYEFPSDDELDSIMEE